MSRFLRQWWTASDPSLLFNAEHRLLSALVKHPYHKPESTRDNHQGMNLVEFRANRTKSGMGDSLPTVILAHGFGSGLSFFYRNIDDLLNSGKISRVICVDWLGMGGSARPPCWESPIRSLFSNPQSSSSPSKFSFCNSKFSPSRAIDFFLDPFDQLLRDDNIFDQGEPLWLVGHSLGGYLAAKYAMRIHGQQSALNATTIPNLTKLILASPVGFQPLPTPDERITSSNLPPALRLVDALWNANLTPQGLVRLMGSSRGKSAVKRALHGRIPHLSEQSALDSEEVQSELDLLANYLYHITVAPASGEYAMNSLLEPAASKDGTGVYAREPLGGGSMVEMMAKKTSPLESIKVLFGDKDWMQFHEPAARKEMQTIDSKCGIRSSVHIVPQAGHHLYIDNASSFGRHILEA
mmetsp:Transcript_2560/g.5477  ORF Transcript_2560/g.5477 Transcript_2560/m.5477 type:complete len:409 (-) Transcript_2560:20-1246(-)